MITEKNSSSPQYMVHFQGQVQGPFHLNFIEAMVLGGVYPNDVKVQALDSNTVEPLNSTSVKHTQGSVVLTDSAKLDYEARHKIESSSRSNGSRNPSPPSSTNDNSWGMGIVGAILLVLVLIYASQSSEPKGTTSQYQSSLPRPDPTPSATAPQPKVSYAPPVPPPFSQPVLGLPASGAFKRYDGRTGVAPLQIQSSVGDHYFVKLEDANSGRPVLAMFIRGGQTEEIEVPLGTYTVKYASGEKWYGERYLFGPETQYSKADQTFTFSSNGYQYSGYTITLYKVRDGNLRTSEIQAADF